MQNVKENSSTSPCFFNSSHFWQSYGKLPSFIKDSRLLGPLLEEKLVTIYTV